MRILPSLVAFVSICEATVALATPAPPAQELLANGAFDTDLASWNEFAGPGSSVAWNALDVAMSPGSGSVRVEVDPSDQGNAVSVTQCVGVVEGTTYDFSGWVHRETPAMGAVASAFIRVQFYREPGCSDNIDSTTTSSASGVDAWEFVSASDVLAPIDALTARIILTNFEDSAQTSNRVVFWDDVSFVPEASTTAALAAALITLTSFRNRRP